MVANPQLVKFLKENIASHTLADLKAILLKQGWNEKDIDEAAESALRSEEHLNDILNVGKEDLIPGTVQDLKANTPQNEEEEEEGAIKRNAHPIKKIVTISVLGAFVVFLFVGWYIMFGGGDEEIVAQQLIDSQPINSVDEAITLMELMSSDFVPDAAVVEPNAAGWKICYQTSELETCCNIRKADGAISCEDALL